MVQNKGEKNTKKKNITEKKMKKIEKMIMRMRWTKK